MSLDGLVSRRWRSARLLEVVSGLGTSITWVRSEMIGLCYGEESCRSVSHLHLSRRRHENITVFLLYTLLLLPPRHLNAIKLILPRDTIRSLWSEEREENHNNAFRRSDPKSPISVQSMLVTGCCWSTAFHEKKKAQQFALSLDYNKTNPTEIKRKRQSPSVLSLPILVSGFELESDHRRGREIPTE